MVRTRLSLILGLLATFASPTSVLGEITFTGTVSPQAPAEVGPTDLVTIGPLRFSDPTGDPRGTVRIDDGSHLTAGQIIVGDNVDALAQLIVTGAQTRLTLADGGNFEMAVAREGSGHVRIDDGAWVEIGSRLQRTGSMTIGGGLFGEGRGGAASVEVAGVGTLLTVGRDLTIADERSATLKLSDGAVAQIGSPFSGGGLAVGLGGEIDVVGSRSELQSEFISLGASTNFPAHARFGELRVRQGAIVRPLRDQPGLIDIGEGGRIFLDDGLIGHRLREVRGTVEGDGTIVGEVDTLATSRMIAHPGDALEVRGAVWLGGRLEATDADLNFRGGFFTNEASGNSESTQLVRSNLEVQRGLISFGSIRLTESTLRSSGDLFRDEMVLGGQFVADSSRVEMFGDVSNLGRLELTDSEFLIGSDGTLHNDRGRIVLQNSSIRSFSNSDGFRNGGVIEVVGGTNDVQLDLDDNTGSGQLIVASDASITFRQAEFYGGTTLGSGSQVLFTEDGEINGLEVDLSDTNLSQPAVLARAIDRDFDEAILDFGGRLTVRLAAMPPMHVDQEFALIEADQLFGNFSEYELPNLPGTLEFLPQLTETTLSLLVIDTTETLPGDFNADGTVDAADFTLWRDGDLPGGSRWLDHALWQNNYGRTLSSLANTVPEPASAVVAVLGLLVGFGLRRMA